VQLVAGLLVALSALAAFALPSLAWTSGTRASLLAGVTCALGAVAARAWTERVAWQKRRLADPSSPSAKTAVVLARLCGAAGVVAWLLSAHGDPVHPDCVAGVLMVAGLVGVAALTLPSGTGWVGWLGMLLRSSACAFAPIAFAMSRLPHGASGHEKFPYLLCMEVLVLMTPVLLAGGALLRADSEVRAHESEAKRYEAMAATYAAAETKLAPLTQRGSAHDVRRLVAEVARDALVENGDWLLMHRDRPLQVPAGG
jgi:hypothetical protein